MCPPRHNYGTVPCNRGTVPCNRGNVVCNRGNSNYNNQLISCHPRHKTQVQTKWPKSTFIVVNLCEYFSVSFNPFHLITCVI